MTLYTMEILEILSRESENTHMCMCTKKMAVGMPMNVQHN